MNAGQIAIVCLAMGITQIHTPHQAEDVLGFARFLADADEPAENYWAERGES